MSEGCSGCCPPVRGQKLAWTGLDHNASLGFARNPLPCISVKTLPVSQEQRCVDQRPFSHAPSAWTGSGEKAGKAG